MKRMLIVLKESSKHLHFNILMKIFLRNLKKNLFVRKVELDINRLESMMISMVKKIKIQ